MQGPGKARNAIWQHELGHLLWHWPLPMLRGPSIRRANTLLLTMELKQTFRAGAGILYPHVFVLLDHFLAIGSELSSNKQANNYSLVIIC